MGRNLDSNHSVGFSPESSMEDAIDYGVRFSRVGINYILNHLGEGNIIESVVATSQADNITAPDIEDILDDEKTKRDMGK